MSLSLRDQLLQAGLLTQKQAKEASQNQHRQRRDEGKNSPAARAAAEARKAEELKAAQAKAARDLELNRQRQEKVEAKARHAQIRQIVEQNKLPKLADSDVLYNFVDGKKIRRLAVTPEMRDRLSSGALLVVRCEGRYEVLPAEAAERVREREPRAVIPLNAESSAPAADDPYKDYVVPDDLMW